MAATILNTPQAMETIRLIVDTFIRIKQIALVNRNTITKLSRANITVDGHSTNFQELFQLLQRTILESQKSVNIMVQLRNINTTTGNHSSLSVQHNNFSGLTQFLKSNLVPLKDIRTLETAVQKDKKINVKTPGKYVGVWMINMLKKVGAGTWKIGIDVATKVLSEIALKYSGLK